ncbi:hypothetical protein N7519_002457 [Penicillium mononematosum]|uniref:uncharacterized protein n=1 Tax=Penicillium mononematosum TaxID=268346 RepID=UPI002547AF95|nr:uncharacterized protein N7519_002457 [Penicillium mononematosum]KAJ6187549.1 hypothetical protein N7519_002457 [Penicillium mononematosum]
MSNPVPSLISDLPEEHVVSLPQLGRLQLEADWIVKWFEKHSDGNQWIVVLGLSTATIETLTSDRGGLDRVAYRFQWEGTTGLIKIIAGVGHGVVTEQFTAVVHDQLRTMGLPRRDFAWFRSTTYRFGTNKGKEADKAYSPPSRYARPIRNGGYPTLVIETGVSKSLGQLRQNARKWFADSGGDVRIVVLIHMRHKFVSFEKWQLAPSEASRPLTQSHIDTLCSHTPNIPPLIRQPAQLQQAYCAHQVDITASTAAGMPNAVTGAPMVLPFIAIQDRPPGPGEGNIVIGPQAFDEMTYLLL